MHLSSSNNNKKQVFVSVIIVAIIAIVGLVFLKQQTTGKLIVKPTGQPANVFIDKTSKGTLPAASSTTFTVRPGQREVLISSNTTYPWRESVYVAGGESKNVKPFLIPRNPRPLRTMSTSTQAALLEIRSQSVAASSSPVISSDKSTRLFVVNNNNLIAQWRKSTTTAPRYYNCHKDTCGVSVYQANNEAIKQIAFYPNRSDVAIFATESGVFAIEINPGGSTQNFQPIATGINNPRFYVNQEDNIVVQSESRVTVTPL